MKEMKMSSLCLCSCKQMMNTHRLDANTLNSCGVLKLEHRVDSSELCSILWGN